MGMRTLGIICLLTGIVIGYLLLSARFKPLTYHHYKPVSSRRNFNHQQSTPSHANQTTDKPHNKSGYGYNIIKPHKKSGHGYIMATHYSDQLRAGMINIFSIQCWAASLKDNLRVVLPFLRDGSHHGIDLSLLANTSSTKKDGPTLFDLTDEDSWIRHVKRRKFTPFVTWDYFLNNAPRKLILVDHYCTKIREAFRDAATKFAEQHGFEIIRSVCNPATKVLSPGEFRTLVYDGNVPHEVVVIFYLYGGIDAAPTKISRKYRVGVSGLQHCSRSRNVQMVPVSMRIRNNTKQYIQKYLSVKKGYVAVMVRFEKLFIKFHLGPLVKKRLEKGGKCIDSIINRIKSLKSNNIFLAMDSSKYGTDSYRSGGLKASYQLAKQLFNKLFAGNGSLTYNQWESSFEDISDFKVPGYIATLQLNIAANADILLLAGGGTFQQYAVRMMDSRHSHFNVAKC